MKAVKIIGYKNSGKSSLILELAKIFQMKGLTVSLAKHACHPPTIPPKDERMLPHVKKYFISSDERAILYFSLPPPLLQMLTLLGSDILILEGFKNEKYIPGIVCWKNENEKTELTSGLEIGFYGAEDWNNASRINDLVNAIEQKGFLLPGLDCEKCNFASCQAFAMEIIAGRKRAEDCVVLQEETKVIINGQEIHLSPFVSHIMKQTFGGFLKSLKGVMPGKAIITMEIET